MWVSIVTACYNSEKTVRDTLESILNQTYDKIEHLIIDGKSSDNTVAIVKEYEEKYKEKGYRLVIVSEKDKGIYDAMNKGIKLATGQLVAMLNSDDWYEPIAVETVVNAYKEEPFDMFYADLNLLKKDGTVIVKHSKMDRFPTSRHWNHPTTFITKDTYNELGAYRCEGLYDDFDLMLRIRKAGKKIVIKNVVLANFRVGGVSTDKDIKKTRRLWRDRYRCYKNNGYSKLYWFSSVAIEILKFIVS